MKNGIFFSIVFLLLQSLSWAATNEVKAIKFEQVGETSNLSIEFAGDGVDANRFHVVEDKQIILDIKNVVAGPKILRGIDASEFSGSVVFINPYTKPGSDKDLRVAIQLRDNVRSILKTTTNSLTLAIENRFGVFSEKAIQDAEEKSTAAVSNPFDSSNRVDINVPRSDKIEDILANLVLSGPKRYVGKKISINVQNLPVIDILKTIAETSGFNIIVANEVMSVPPLTLRLTNIPWDQALDTVMELSKLTASKKENILTVTTVAKATEEEKRRQEIEKMKQGAEPLVTKIFPISFSNLESLTNTLKDYLTAQRGKMSIDQRTNVIIVQDTVEVIERVRKIIEVLDTQTPQILIEAKIVEATESFSQNLGLSNGLAFGYDPITASGGTNTGPGLTFSSISSGGGSDGSGGTTFLGLQVGLFKRLTNLDLQLQLMEQESRGKIVSSPKVITQNKQAATLSSSDSTSFAVQSKDSTGTTTTSYEQVAADLNLTVTPQVANDGSISMNVQISKSSFGDRPSTSAPPNTTTRSVNTQVLVDNGSTVVIGGLYNIEKSETVSGVPFLKDIPILGWLFRSAYAPTEKKSEMIIFLTPRIINQEAAGLSDRKGSV